MEAARYHFVSEYTFQGDQHEIWRVLMDFEHAPHWWKGVKRVEILRPSTNSDGIGLTYHCYVRAPSGYTFDYSSEIADVDPLRRIDLLSSGELVGHGRFLLTESPTGTLRLTFDWKVETPKGWISLLTPIARPIFTWNHDKLMTSFGRGLARASGAKLLSAHNMAFKPAAAVNGADQSRHTR